MLQASFCKYILKFKNPAMTSREVMLEKPTYYIKVWHDSEPEVFGIGECGLFPGLSCDDRPDFETRLSEACRSINEIAGGDTALISDFPSIMFGVETALLDLENGGRRIIYPSLWTAGEMAITINGLVWMGSKDEMIGRLGEKLAAGFRCIKFKVGGLDFEQELDMISSARKAFSPEELEIRLDANGGFTPENALSRLDRLAELDIHSIEQPIKQRQWNEMAEICRLSPIPVALDEELIGITHPREMARMIDTVRPAYIILKPSLCGGFSGCSNWIEAASRHDIGWWATSALESNIGLNAIAQWVATQNVSMPQGLGTGQLYLNNVESPIRQTGQTLVYSPDREWSIPDLEWN